MNIYYVENATNQNGDNQEYFGYGAVCIKDGVQYQAQNAPGSQIVVYGAHPDERLYTITGETRIGASAEYTYVEKTTQEARAVLVPLVKNTVQAYLDEVARDFGYDDINSAVSYASDDTDATWQSEGIALRKYRSNVWKSAFAYMDATEKPMPENVIAELPSLDAVVGFEEYRAMILRRADAIEATNPAQALALRQSVA